MRSLLPDIRSGARALVKNPGFTLLAVITLAAGIAASTITFSVLNSFNRPLPVEKPEEIVAVSEDFEGHRARHYSYPDYLYYQQRSADVMAELAAYAIDFVHVTIDGNTDRAAAAIVTGNYFRMLGVEPIAGRGFLPSEDLERGAHPVAMISED